MSLTADGRIADDGTVYVRMPDGSEHAVGQWAAGDPEAGLAHFRRRYDDLLVEANLARTRLQGGSATPEAAIAVAQKLQQAIANPNFVGDIPALQTRADALLALVGEKRAATAAAKQHARDDAASRREAIAAEAESLADSTAWKPTGQRFRELLDEWKALPRFDKAAEQALWDRFSAARSTFDKARRKYFADLDVARSDAAMVKERLIQRAEALSGSTDWATTAREFRDLMAQWKAAPRAGRDAEDKLWAAFRAAQDKFFEARNQVFSARNEEEESNLAAKRAILADVEKLFPVTDHRSARAQFSRLMERWDTIGFVPRDAKQSLERQLRAVEKKIAAAEQDHWRRTDPAARALAERTAETFRASVAKLEKQLSAAEDSGDERKISDTRKALDSTRGLLEAAESALASFTGG